MKKFVEQLKKDTYPINLIMAHNESSIYIINNESREVVAEVDEDNAWVDSFVLTINYHEADREKILAAIENISSNVNVV